MKPLWIKLVIYVLIFTLVVTTVLAGAGLFF
ncbi:MAG: stressosome-associated protein Prli42 [Planifilum fimeticola]